MRKILDAMAVPRLARLAFAVIALDVLAFSLLRAGFYLYFRSPLDPVPSGPLLKAFYIGMKFDVRLALLIALPLFVLGPVRGIGVFRGRAGRLLFTLYLVIAHFLAFAFYSLDFGHYAYLEERLNATALRFVENLAISVEMIWQTYPIVWIGAGLFVFIALAWLVFWRLIRRGAMHEPHRPGWLGRWAMRLVVLVLVLGGIYGKASNYPLRWSDAYFSPHKFASELALNPILYFAETMGLQEEPYDKDKARMYYPLMASYLKVDEPGPGAGVLDYSRLRPARGQVEGSPNVVVVLLESFVHYKVGAFGNPLDPTPNFDRLSREGMFFKRFYTPSTGTARSVFAFLTGLPDVESRETSSRNPLIVKQRSMIDVFEDYDKYYFLGGSVNWANIRGLLSHNIEGIEIYEEGSYSSPRGDVWGISDLHLFEEADRVLASRDEGEKAEGKKPFFAIIQTSGNHRPYTIPGDNRGFKYSEQEDEEKTRRYGFYSTEEYNSYRFMDHSIGFFMREAKKHAYFDNTVFVFFGDHGLPGNSPTMLKSEQQLYLTNFHVPLLIYAPSMMGGLEVDKVASELDVLPTLASLLGMEGVNTTLGRDLLDPAYDGERYAFTITGQGRTPEIGVISKGFYYRTFLKDGDGTLHEYLSDTPRDDVSGRFPGVAAEMDRMARAYYETARYIRYHNKGRER